MEKQKSWASSVDDITLIRFALDSLCFGTSLDFFPMCVFFSILVQIFIFFLEF